jgi:16S rRNA (cytosine1402-N4)-methyltransferase
VRPERRTREEDTTNDDQGTDERTATHEPVLLEEALQFLQPERGGVFVDCTLGLGGHTRALLERGATRVIGIDRDADALRLATERLQGFGDQFVPVHSDYRQIGEVLDAHGSPVVDGVLADLGISSLQLDADGRGFSFRRDEPLDMRMDRSGGATAADLVNRSAEREIADAIFQFGEERYSRRIARGIVAARPLTTTGQLASIVRRAVPTRGWQRIDPATRTFQALRIWVNGELDGLDQFVHDAASRLREGGRLVVITFHSLEDRIVKHTMRGLAQDGSGLQVLTKKPLVASDAERGRNPRSRSAKLRALARV